MNVFNIINDKFASLIQGSETINWKDYLLYFWCKLNGLLRKFIETSNEISSMKNMVLLVERANSLEGWFLHIFKFCGYTRQINSKHRPIPRRNSPPRSWITFNFPIARQSAIGLKTYTKEINCCWSLKTCYFPSRQLSLFTKLILYKYEKQCGFQSRAIFAWRVVYYQIPWAFQSISWSDRKCRATNTKKQPQATGNLELQRGWYLRP